MKKLLLGAGLFVWLSSFCAAADTDRLFPSDLRWYQAIKPAASEMRWRDIPWMLDLESSVKQAKKEKRPLFIWVAGDDPLERC